MTQTLVKRELPVFRPYSTDEEIEAVTDVLRSGWWGAGRVTARLEAEFAEFVGAKHAVAVNSATAALHLSLLVAGVGAGDEVITTPLTFVSTNHAILYVGATPVFADVLHTTLCLDAADVERRITPRTKAIMVVDYAGHPAYLHSLYDIAERHHLTLIEDAAHAAGASYWGKMVGSIAPLTCFSFHAVKNIASPDGGMVTTDNDEWAARIRKLRWLGIDRETYARVGGSASEYAWQYDVEEVGFKYNPNDIMAAIALCQLRRLNKTNMHRHRVASRYHDGLSDLDWLELPANDYNVQHAWHAYVVRFDNRDALADHLRARGIATGVHYLPNHLYSVYERYYTHLPVVDREWLRLLTLPLYPSMTDSDVDYVIEAIRDFRPT